MSKERRRNHSHNNRWLLSSYTTDLNTCTDLMHSPNKARCLVYLQAHIGWYMASQKARTGKIHTH